ncbi:MAG: chromate transporter [Candidatus Izemoplasmatales bacterium]
MEDKKHNLMNIYFTFFMIGIFTFGGGYVMIPFIEKEMVEKKKWIKKSEIIDIIAITQSIPGALSTNMSALVGYKIAKIKGAIVAVLGVISPSFIIIVLIAAFFSQFQDLEVVQNAFLGIRSMVVALIAVASIKIFKSAVVDINTLIIVLITVSLLLVTSIEPIYIILGGLLFGMVIYYIFPQTTIKILKKGDDYIDID